MKYMVIIADGIADTQIEALGGRSPLEALDLPHFRRLAGTGMGRARTVPEGVPAGSDTAILSIFGYDPRVCYTGRSPLEAAGSGVPLREGEISFRINLVTLEGDSLEGARILSHNGGNVEGEEVDALIAALLADKDFCAAARALGLTLHAGRGFRHIGVTDAAHAPDSLAYNLTEPHNILLQPIAAHLPQGTSAEALTALMRASYAVLKDHPVNAGRSARGALPANCLWPWGAGRAVVLPAFEQLHGKRAAVISAVPLVWGIAALAGLPAPRVPGATGDVDTNYGGKVQAALDALRRGCDAAFLHVEAPDECAHAGDVAGKCEAMRRIDSRVVAPLLDQLPLVDPDFRILLLSDHYTLLTTRKHDGTPVPYCLYDSRFPGSPRAFDEQTVLAHPLLEDGTRLLTQLFRD